MLASRTRYLWWARQRRQHDASLSADDGVFRALSKQWQPVVKPKAKLPRYTPDGASAPRRRATWSPWLWIKG